MDKTRHIVILVPPQTSLLDVAGPLEVFSKTSDYMTKYRKVKDRYYTTHLVSMDDTMAVPTSSGMPVICEGGISGIRYPIDTVIIAGRGEYRKGAPAPILKWIQKINKSKSKVRIASICAGAFILAETGLLDSRRATTHWQLHDKLAEKFPLVKVEKDPIYIKQGNIYTSAGISTGIDLTLALVEEDLGREVAIEISRILVLYLKRPGNQSQFSNILMTQKTDYRPVKDSLQWIQEHLDEDLSVERLAAKASMSARNFSRVFYREAGITPAKFVEKARVEAARRRLEETGLSLDEIAAECGTSDANGLRRLFIRHLNTTPAAYRKSFA
ncbi:GlxA family transcriptional regulator [Chitinophaga sp. 212800010-3]|uniref:GlxA family transcriptional regulator n=1 Tax=unclassified Chitinophaga TaxID=2619133 RepID=UPI002DF005ED|nr:Transcriptional regulator GlxA family [Chitinophaga sp. 212800010-3]